MLASCQVERLWGLIALVCSGWVDLKVLHHHLSADDGAELWFTCACALALLRHTLRCLYSALHHS